MKQGGVPWLSAGAVSSAVAASICCVGPLALAMLGLGGGALLLKLAPYRPYFLTATALLLGAAFYLTYRERPQAQCLPGETCTRNGQRGQRILLWIVTVFVLLAAASPYLMEAFL